MGAALNAIDAAVVGLVGLGALLGARRGFVAQVARLFALGGGLLIARAVAPEAGALLREAFPSSLSPPLDRHAAFLAVFAAVAAGVALAGAWLRESVRAGPLAGLDRAGGALVGAGKGLLLCYVGLFVVLCYPSRPLGRELRRSSLAPVLLEAIGAPAPLFPPEFEARGREEARAIARARAAGGDCAAPPVCAIGDLPTAEGESGSN